jgi:MFS family permease
MPYLSTMGISRTFSSLVASAIPISNICGRLGFGWLGNKLDKKKLTVWSIAFTGVGVFFFSSINIGGIYMLIPFLLFFGAGWGSSVIMRVILLRGYFGRSSFGTIHGLTVGIMMLGNIIGPPLVGWVFDKQGNYQNIWLILAVLSIIPVIIMATIPSLVKPTQPAKYR